MRSGCPEFVTQTTLSGRIDAGGAVLTLLKYPEFDLGCMHGLAVQQDDARAAVPLTAPDLGAGQPEVTAQLGALPRLVRCQKGSMPQAAAACSRYWLSP